MVDSPLDTKQLRGVEVFAGGGGLLLGGSLAGIDHLAAVEWNKWACSTMRRNAMAGHKLVSGLRVIESDVRDVQWSEVVGNKAIDIVTGGPPCQPFSSGGLARSADDPRDMFPAVTSVIEKLQPRAFVIENVKGLTRKAFRDYFNFIQLQLQHPEIRARDSETWEEHYARLQKEHKHAATDLKYNLYTTTVNAADYGIPQHRHRVFLVGFRNDLNIQWSFPAQTHSGAALAFEQASGRYWNRFNIPVEDRVQIRRAPAEDGLLPWRTVREALLDVPEPLMDGTPGWLDHKLQLGARSYPGHTGSPLDAPSKALKAGGHGVPGGENMIRFPDGSLRYYSIREAARIQTFPDNYRLEGAWGEAMRQLGNAVPVELAEIILTSVTQALQDSTPAKLKEVS